MSSTSSVTFWISQLKAGNLEAAQPLWERYFEKMVRLARHKLLDNPRRAADEEDVALSAFDSFCQGVCQGRFPQLRDRDNLWPLLVVITARKAIDLVKRENRQKRGGGAVQGESEFLGPTGNFEEERGIEMVVGPEPTPEFAVSVAEEYRLLLDRLGDDELRAVAMWKMEGYTTEEIAKKLGCAARSVERRLRAIRSIWEYVEGAE